MLLSLMLELEQLLNRTEKDHKRWLLKIADMKITTDSLLDGFEIGDRHPAVLFSSKLDVGA